MARKKESEMFTVVSTGSFSEKADQRKHVTCQKGAKQKQFKDLIRKKTGTG